MKRIICIVLVTLISISAIFADEIVSITDGRQIALKDDGTYEFVENEGLVTIVLTEAKDVTDSLGDTYLTLTFRIENNSYGTIYLLRAPVTAYNDRGQQIDNYAMSMLDTKDWDTIYINKGSSRELEVEFKGASQYLKDVYLGTIKPEYFNMRMLPEGMKISSIIVCRSEIDGVTLSKSF